MLIASTYPLYPSNQWITTPFHDGARVFFSDRGAEGLYNATVAHLWEMSADEPDDRSKETVPQLLEFGQPYDVTPALSRKPPVWISAVGERGLYPITYKPKGSSYLYDPQTAPKTRLLAKWPIEESTAAERKQPVEARLDTARAASNAMQPSPHLFFWLICLFLIVACPSVAVVTWIYVAWSVDPGKYERDGHPSSKHLLKWLNCDVAEKVGDSEIKLLFLSANAENAKITQPNNSIAAQALVGHLELHFSDSRGQVQAISQLRQATEDKKLKSQLQPLWLLNGPGDQKLTEKERAAVLSAVGSMIGRPHLGKGVYRDPRSKELLEGRNFNPDDRYRDQKENPFPPPSGAGASVAH